MVVRDQVHRKKKGKKKEKEKPNNL